MSHIAKKAMPRLLLVYTPKSNAVDIHVFHFERAK
jgi:hypothetical protein